MSYQIPKVRKLFRGDINEAVIKIRVEITHAWWFKNVGNNAPTYEILDKAYGSKSSLTR